MATKDETERLRRTLVNAINAHPGDRETLEKLAADHRVWNTEELSKDFDVIGFLAPFVAVRRKSDGKNGTLLYQHSPRFYFDFTED